MFGVFVASLLTTPVHAVKDFKISGYEGGHQIWFEVEEFDERSPEGDQYYPVVDADGAFGQAITRAGGAGGMIRWTFDISTAGGEGGTWYFWARQINPGNTSDYMLVEGDPGDTQIPTGPPFPGGDGVPFSNEDDRVFEIDVGPLWGWAQSWDIEGHAKELQDDENTMYIYHRQGDNTVFWDVFMWTDDPDYVPTDEDYQNAMTILPGAASIPSPLNGATDVTRNVVLDWMSEKFASPINGNKVYFSDNIGDVIDRIGGITQTPSSYAVPQRLEFGTMYYWLVDVITPDGTVLDGTIWSFMTELFAYPVQNITATASSSSLDKEPENTVNGSGLDADGLLHGNAGAGTMWLSDIADPQPAWILFEFDNVYKLDEMWVWNSNESLEQAIGLGFKDVVIEYSTDGVDFTTLGTTHEFAQGDGSASYAHNTTVDMEGLGAKYVRLTANSSWKNILPQFGLSEVRFFSIPVQANQPDPASGATGTDLDPVLGWTAGREAATHDVYFSDDLQAVMDGTATVTSATETSHGPLSLDVGTTYYWRIDEVNEAETPSTWQGNIWDFTTVDSLLVEDFESYDSTDNQIWYAWKDGLGYGTPDTPPYYAGNGTGAAVGDETTESFTEETIVHGDRQSMPLVYNNNKQGYLNYSEVTMTLTSQRNWTASGVKELSLWFRGSPGSVGSFAEGPAGIYTMTAAGTDIWDVHDEFHFAYKQLTGVGSIIAKVESVDNTDPWAKAGVMIRDTLDPGSKFAGVYVTPTNDDGTPTQGCRFQGRTDTDGSATSDTSVATDEQKAVTAPYWVKLERDFAGNLRGYYSSDGSTWVPLSWRPSISMSSNVYIGLAVTSHNAALTCEAKLSGVQTTGTVTGQWQSQDIGISSNSAETMYVVVGNSAGAPAVIYHDDPAPTQIDTWTEWVIDLNQFADQGVNLADVDNISIGLGDRNNTQPGGSGTIYIDDIRLYGPRVAAEE